MAWRVTVGDWPTTVIPYLCIGGSAFLVGMFPLRELPILLLKMLVYGFLYVYAFTTVNQLICVEEDRANKPHRPLAMGLVTRQWMARRAAATHVLFVAAGFLFGAPWPTLTWLAMIHLHNFRGIYLHWFFKNVIFITVGAAVEITATWEIISPHVALPWVWISVNSLLVGIGCNNQDIRDVAGDRLAGRRTMPIIWGEKKARIFIAAFLLAVPLIQYVAQPWPCPGVYLKATLGIPGAVIWVSATRYLIFQNPRSDHWSYQIYCFWWCSTLLLQPIAISGRFS